EAAVAVLTRQDEIGRLCEPRVRDAVWYIERAVHRKYRGECFGSAVADGPRVLRVAETPAPFGTVGEERIAPGDGARVLVRREERVRTEQRFGVVVCGFGIR